MSAAADQGKTEADSSLNQSIRQALNADSALGASAKNVHFDTDNGKVTLHGTVATDKEKKDIEAKVEKMTGVKDVDNQLEVGSAATSGAAGSTGSTSSAGGSMGSTSSAEPSGSSTMGERTSSADR